MSAMRGRALALLVAGAIAVAAAASGCHSKSYSPPSGGDDSGGGDAGPCECTGVGLGFITIGCGKQGCDQDVLYCCDKDGTTYHMCGACMSPPMDAASECQPTCDGLRCGSDGCGGMCMCPANLMCNTLSQRCSNGCTLTTGDPCPLDGGSGPGSCCEVGQQCLVDDAGLAACCASVGSLCSVDSDCCAPGKCDTMHGTCK